MDNLELLINSGFLFFYFFGLRKRYISWFKLKQNKRELLRRISTKERKD